MIEARLFVELFERMALSCRQLDPNEPLTGDFKYQANGKTYRMVIVETDEEIDDAAR